jgi:hypothetical protein
VGIDMGSDQSKWVPDEQGRKFSAALACSPECAVLLAHRAAGAAPPDGQTGGIKRLFGFKNQGRSRP